MTNQSTDEAIIDQEFFTLDNGDLNVWYPRVVTVADCDDVEAYFAILLRKMRRRAGVMGVELKALPPPPTTDTRKAQAPSRWTEHEDAELRRLWALGGRAEIIAEYLNRPLAGVYRHAIRLNLPRRQEDRAADPIETPDRNKRAATHETPVRNERAVPSSTPVPRERAEHATTPDAPERADDFQTSGDIERAAKAETPARPKRAAVLDETSVRAKRAADPLLTSAPSKRAALGKPSAVSERAVPDETPELPKRAATEKTPAESKRGAAPFGRRPEPETGPRLWTPTDDSYLRSHWQTQMPMKEMMVWLDRTENAINARAYTTLNLGSRGNAAGPSTDSTVPLPGNDGVPRELQNDKPIDVKLPEVVKYLIETGDEAVWNGARRCYDLKGVSRRVKPETLLTRANIRRNRQNLAPFNLVPDLVG